MMRLSHTASFHATNHKYCSAHSDDTKRTCRDLLLHVSVGDHLMACIVFALHNQSWNLVDGLFITMKTYLSVSSVHVWRLSVSNYSRFFMNSDIFLTS